MFCVSHEDSLLNEDFFLVDLLIVTGDVVLIVDVLLLLMCWEADCEWWVG